MSSFIKIPLILSLVTMLTAGLLMLSADLTRDRIEQQKTELLLKSLEDLIPNQLHDNNLVESVIEIYEPEVLGHRKPQTAYLGMQNNQLSVVAIPVTARDGYSGDIDIMVGIKSNGEITTVKIIEQHETPGLGDLVIASKSDWLKQFPQKSFQYPTKKNWLVKRDGGEFDQITGATITPRAIVKAIKQALDYYQTHQAKFQIKDVLIIKAEKTS